MTVAAPTVGESESEKRFRIMADAAPVMIWMSGTDMRCDWFNAGWLRFTGRLLGDESGEGWIGGVHPEDREHLLATYRAAFERKEGFSLEYRLRRHDGAYRWVLDRGEPRYEGEGEFAGYIGSCVEVHEHRAREAELALLLRDKEVLLKEVHHRVKNNFQLVMSLISFRLRLAPAGPERARLHDLQDRIGVIAGIQEQLVAQPHVSRIDPGAQLRRLAREQQAQHGGTAIRLEEAIGPAEMGVDAAVALGLIAAELLSNAYRHAFPQGRHGVIGISLTQAADGRVELTIRDDGIGMPTPAATPQAVGLQIVEALAAQAGGEVETISPPGTRVTIRLPA
jgi:PAS domain S-box-containing protein